MRIGPKGFAVVLLAPLAVYAAGLGAKGGIERREGLCVSCHTSSGAVLHGGLMEDLRAEPPTTLASLHKTHGGERFECATCHGGHDLKSKSISMALAARDVVHQLLWEVREPESLTIPLGDAACVRCHASYKPRNLDSFHAIPAHADPFPRTCASCHAVHDRGGRADLYFLDEPAVLAECRTCHAGRELSLEGEYETTLSNEEALRVARRSNRDEKTEPRPAGAANP